MTHTFLPGRYYFATFNSDFVYVYLDDIPADHRVSRLYIPRGRHVGCVPRYEAWSLQAPHSGQQAQQTLETGRSTGHERLEL